MRQRKNRKTAQVVEPRGSLDPCGRRNFLTNIHKHCPELRHPVGHFRGRQCPDFLRPKMQMVQIVGKMVVFHHSASSNWYNDMILKSESCSNSGRCMCVHDHLNYFCVFQLLCHQHVLAISQSGSLEDLPVRRTNMYHIDPAGQGGPGLANLRGHLAALCHTPGKPSYGCPSCPCGCKGLC